MLTTAGHSGCAAAQCTASMPPSDMPTTNGLSRPSVSRAATAPEKVHGVKPPLRPCPGRSAAITVKSSVDRKSTRLNSSHVAISYAVFCLKKKKKHKQLEK